MKEITMAKNARKIFLMKQLFWENKSRLNLLSPTKREIKFLLTRSSTIEHYSDDLKSITRS